jgi:hypothetical protein
MGSLLLLGRADGLEIMPPSLALAEGGGCFSAKNRHQQRAWRSSKTPGTQQELSNACLNPKEYMHCVRDGSSFTIPSETPCAELHARCCGKSRVKTGSYPARMLIMSGCLDLFPLLFTVIFLVHHSIFHL